MKDQISISSISQSICYLIDEFVRISTVLERGTPSKPDQEQIESIKREKEKIIKKITKLDGLDKARVLNMAMLILAHLSTCKDSESAAVKMSYVIMAELDSYFKKEFNTSIMRAVSTTMDFPSVKANKK